MWVLIVMTMASYGQNQAAIPGYATEAKCAAAGSAWVERMNRVTISAKFVCIPGPEQS